jgi:tetratricopeptide (TPR) repeat protein
LKDHRRPAGLPYPDGGFTRTALKLEPEEERADFSSRYNRAILHFEAGQYETARLLLLDLLSERHRFKRDFDHCSEPRYYLARIHRYQGDRNAALEALRSGLRKTPGNPFLLSLLYVTTGFEEHRHRLFRYFDRISGSFLLGQAFLDHDQPRKALPYFRYVVQTLPEYRRGWIYLASALARSGADNEAARSFIRAIKKRSDPVFFENEMVSVFQRWQQHDPGDISRRFLYGLVLRYFGRYHQALEIQKSLSERFPENVDVATEIGLLERVINGAGVQPQVR